MAMVRVQHEYIGREPDELTIHKGDVIRDVIRKPGGWWEGVLNDKKGVFPDNFVKIIESNITKYKKQCKVIFNYEQDHEDELSLNIGEIVDILGEEEEGWWRGILNGKEGVFPSNFVEEINHDVTKHSSHNQDDSSNESDNYSPILPPKPSKVYCKVNFNYEAQNDDELSLSIGDIVTLINKDGQDPGWWKGELSGSIGVFPDNFVAIITNHEDKKEKTSNKDAKSVNSSVASQRKSLELKREKDKDAENIKTTPPIPGKKPIVPIKKSPSGSTSSGGSSSGGLFSGLKKKIVDVVDGATNSKSVNNVQKVGDKIEKEKSDENENAFDQVERNSLLSDVRATRAKAPGRRPPSTIFKEDISIINGTSDHSDTLNSSTGSVEQEMNELKPKVREWEKHKVPWLEEMKYNQARRTATSPGPEQNNKLKLTPDKLEDDNNKFDTISPIDMSKSMPSLSTKLKTPTNELEKSTPPAILRNKPTQITHLVKPIAINNNNNNNNNNQNVDSSKVSSPKMTTTNISQVNKNVPSSATTTTATPSTTVNKTDRCNDTVSTTKPISEQHHHQNVQDNIFGKQYGELLDRIVKLENIIERQNIAHKLAIDELKGKLQVETDMRMLLQVEVDKLSQCVMQV